MLTPLPALPLRHRLTGATEKMDRADCDQQQLERTYRNFGVVNAALSGWKSVYRREIRPRLSATRSSSLLDIGSGGGDVPRQFLRWAQRDGLRLSITAIDADARAVRYAQSLSPLPGLEFRQAMSHDLVAEGQRFNFVTSNHLLHHLTNAELTSLLEDCQALCSGTVIHSDIERSALAYALFGAATLPLFRGSFIHYDGLLSIRRSYTAPELQRSVPGGWRVARLFPYRNLLIYRAGA
ncbi:class I SAM-dependent methyltransferase [Deinococcus sp.]|uniref:class I SAM-dependent methyltransferase n=1 Tax=Deinococcus sp. TaxID=47478 RepID=UPI0025F9FEF1|nr:class I SAM-dependent methyltransferase [Deinococcus sp.]